MKTHSFAPTEGRQSAGSGPEAVCSLGHKLQHLSFRLDHELHSGLGPNPVQDSARISLQTHTHTPGLCCVVPREERVIHLGGGVGGDAHGPGHVTECPASGAPRGYFRQSSG